MLNLYARFALWLIRPALELHEAESCAARQQEIGETVLNGMLKSGSPVSDGLAYVFGLKRIRRE